MLLELLISTFGAYIATSGLRDDAATLKGQALDNYYKAEQTRATIIELNKGLNHRIDVLEEQHAAIYQMTEWVAVLQTLQMKGGKYIGNEIYRVIDHGDTTMVDMSRRIISERKRGIVYWRDYNDNSEYINGQLVHEFRKDKEIVYNLEGTKVYVKEPYNQTWKETWYHPDKSEAKVKIDRIVKCFDPEGNVTCWMDGDVDILAQERAEEEAHRKRMEEIAEEYKAWQKCAIKYHIGECIPKCENEGFFSKLKDAILYHMDCYDKCTQIQNSACGHRPS